MQSGTSVVPIVSGGGILNGGAGIDNIVDPNIAGWDISNE